RAEQAKLSAQVGEAKVTRVTEEYKTGLFEQPGTLVDVMETMVNDTANLAAEAQGAAAAQNIQKKNIAEMFTEEVEQQYVDADNNTVTRNVPSARAQELLNIAASVDEYGEMRAQASATSTLNEITT